MNQINGLCTILTLLGSITSAQEVIDLSRGIKPDKVGKMSNGIISPMLSIPSPYLFNVLRIGKHSPVPVDVGLTEQILIF